MAAPTPSGASGAPPPARLRTVLARPGVASAFLLSLAARLPSGAVAALLALRIGPVHGFAIAGLIDATYAVVLAVVVPLWARLLERLGPSRVLGPLSVVHAAALASLGLISDHASPFVFAALAALAGASEPVFGGAMRGLWDQLLSDDAERHVGYSLESAALEGILAISGALFVGVVAAVGGPGTALAAAGATTLVFGVGFAAAPAVRHWASLAGDERSGGALGALAHPGARTLVAVSAAVGLQIGPIDIGLPAFGSERESTAIVGVLLTIWALGSMFAGLVMTRVPAARDPQRRMIVMLAWLSLTGLALGAATTPVLAGVLLFATGMGLAPFFATLNGSFEQLAPGEAVAELYGLTLSGVLIGAMLGAPAAGLLVDHVSANAALAASAVGPLLGIAILVTRRRDLAPSF